MVSRRNFFTITAIMAIVFFLFQSLNMAREHENDYMINAFAGQDETLLPRSAAFSGDTPGRQKAAYIGAENGASKETAANWCLYTKRTFSEYRTLSEYNGSDADILLVDGDYFNQNGGAQALLGYTEKGTVIIFCGLPDKSVITESAALKQLLGIKDIREETDVAGVRLYPGLLLGGGAVYNAETESDAEKYQDFPLDFPRYSLAAGTKTYMCGIPADDTKDNEEHPPIIWRNSCGNSKVFAVNGNYISGAAGLGILTGFMAEAAEYELYPVVNARNMVIAGCPALANENSEKIEALYSKDMSGLFTDLILPSLESLNERCGMGFTFMLRTRFDYGGALPDGENLEYYLKEINAMRGEAGIFAADTPQSLQADAEFFRAEIPDFAFTSAYAEEASALSEYGSIRTAVSPYDGGGIIGYRDDLVTYQKALSDGFSHTYMDDFRLRSVMSALGYSCVLTDMERAAYPKTSDDSWEKLSKALSESVTAAPDCFEAFDGTTLTQSDKRVRSFLALDYSEARDGVKDVITLRTSGNSDSAWFILRLHNRAVESVEGGNFTKIEDGAYLIEVRAKSAEIRLCDASERYYYE